MDQDWVVQTDAWSFLKIVLSPDPTYDADSGFFSFCHHFKLIEVSLALQTPMEYMSVQASFLSRVYSRLKSFLISIHFQALSDSLQVVTHFEVLLSSTAGLFF